jgi:hypothetical protein
MRKRFGLLLLPFLIAIVVSIETAKIAHDYWKFREPLRTKETESKMRELMELLDAEGPVRVDPESIRSLLVRKKRLEWLTDGWGGTLLVQRNEREKGRYVVTSLGRDGRRGSCCKRWVNDWNDDAVLSGDEWVQVWEMNPTVSKNFERR